MLQDREINGLLFYYDAEKDECILPSLKDDSVLTIARFGNEDGYRALYTSDRTITATLSPRFYEVPDVVQYMRSQGYMDRLGFERSVEFIEGLTSGEEVYNTDRRTMTRDEKDAMGSDFTQGFEAGYRKAEYDAINRKAARDA